MVYFNGKVVDMEEELLRPLTHIYPERAHDSIKENLPNIYQYWLNIPDSKFEEIKNFTEMYINLTCIFDDVQDQSTYRRTIPSSHSVYGEPLTINASLHVLALCAEKVLNLDHPEAIDLFLDHYLEMMRGQGEDIFRREHQICPTEDEFKELAYKKASLAFLLTLRLMQLFSENKTDYGKIIRNYGIYYVIRDDYCNLMKPECYEGQQRSPEIQCINDTNFCEDLTDGKYSWLVVHALQFTEGHPLLYLMRQHTRDMGKKVYYRLLLERLGSVEYTRATLDKYDADLRKELAEIGGNPLMEELLDDYKVWK